MILVTGGAGFIGSHFAISWIDKEKTPLINLDKLTYAGNLSNINILRKNLLHQFIKGDIGDRPLINQLLKKFHPRAILNFAAETHVDRSIHYPENFIQTNIVELFHLLEESLAYWKQLHHEEQQAFRFVQLSTDEVYGSLAKMDPSSTEQSLYAPNSPYAASKASGDYLVRAYHQTFGLPTLTIHSTNNFGPHQYPEKLIPLTILNAVQGKALPIYGDGQNIRNWLYVEDNCEAIRHVLAKGKPGETYNVGSQDEVANLDLVLLICSILDELKPDSPFKPHSSLIKYVKDRPGHDRRSSLDSTKIKQELGWKPQGKFKDKMRDTIKWYLEHGEWVEKATDRDYQNWVNTHYAEK